AVQARWNLTDLVTARDRQRVAQSKIQQAHLAYQELRAKLTLGVREAHEAIQSGREQMDLGRQQIQTAINVYERSTIRFNQKIKGYSLSEVLLAIRAKAGSELTYINAIRDTKKAQLRMLILLGGGSQECRR